MSLPHITIPKSWEPYNDHGRKASKSLLESENKIPFECIEDYDFYFAKFEKGQTYYGVEVPDYSGWGIDMINEEYVHYFNDLEVEKYFKVIKPNKSL